MKMLLHQEFFIYLISSTQVFMLFFLMLYFFFNALFFSLHLFHKPAFFYFSFFFSFFHSTCFSFCWLGVLDGNLFIMVLM